MRWWVVVVFLFFFSEPVLASHPPAHAQKVCQAMPWGKGGRPVIPRWFMDLPAIRALRESPKIGSIFARLMDSPAMNRTINRITHSTNHAAMVSDIGAMVLVQYTTAEAKPRDRPLWEVMDPDLWGTPTDAPTVGLACFVATMSMYVTSWLALGGFWFYLLMMAQRDVSRTTSQGKITFLLGWTAFFTCLLFAIAAYSCTVDPEDTATPCLTRSRKRFNFLWPGIVLMNLGGHLAVKQQDKDRSLESYVLKRQMLRDKVLRRNSDYDTNPTYNVHKASVEATKQMMDVEEMTQKSADSKEKSLVLAPVHSKLFESLLAMLTQNNSGMTQAHFLSFAGIIWVAIAAIYLAASCGVEEVNHPQDSQTQASVSLSNVTPFALTPNATALADGAVSN